MSYVNSPKARETYVSENPRYNAYRGDAHHSVAVRPGALTKEGAAKKRRLAEIAAAVMRAKLKAG